MYLDLYVSSDVDIAAFTEKAPGIIRAATQYGTASQIIDLATFDVTHNPWRCGELFDAIVTDPPCALKRICLTTPSD